MVFYHFLDYTAIICIIIFLIPKFLGALPRGNSLFSSYIDREINCQKILKIINKFLAISHNVPAYAMFASGIIARSAYHWQIWV